MNNKLSNKFIIILTIVAVLSIIIIPTWYKTSKIHKNRAREVVKKEILEAAEKCFNENNCKNNETTLKDLYDLNYLSEKFDPITKKIYDPKTIIVNKNGDYYVNLK